MWRDPLGLLNPRHKRPGVMNPPLAGGGGPPGQVAPAITTQPSLTGSTALGSTITVSLGAASGTPAPTLTGTLTRPAKAAVQVADGATFVVEAADLGGTIAVGVTATNEAGSATASAEMAVPLPALAEHYGIGPGKVETDWRFDDAGAVGAQVTGVRNDGGLGASLVITPGTSAPVVADGAVDFTNNTQFLNITGGVDLQARHLLMPVYLQTLNLAGGGDERFARLLSHTTGGQRVALNLRDDAMSLVSGSGATTGDLPAPLRMGTWMLVEVRYVGERVTFYINGQPVSSTASMSTGAMTLNRLGRVATTPHWLRGMIGRTVMVTAASASHDVLEDAVLIARKTIMSDQRYGFLPNPPVLQVAADWSSDDAHWDAVTVFSDFRRHLGLDQSESALSIDYVPEKVPTFDANGAVFDGASGYVTGYDARLGMGNVDATVELFGVMGSGDVARVVSQTGVVQWAVRHNGTAWVVTVNNGGSPANHTITDPVPAAAVDLALVRSGTTLRFFRNGALLYTGSAGAWALGSQRLVVAGAVAPFAALRIAGVRVTRGVARYSGTYVPTFPGVTAAKAAGGALRVAYGGSTIFSDPNVLPDGDKILYGMTTMEALVGDHDLSTRRSRMKSVWQWSKRDAHNNPAYVRMPSGEVVYIAPNHSTATLVRGVTDATGDILTAGATSFSMPGVTDNAYVNLFQLEGEAGAPIYLVARASYQAYIARTYDNGQTWERPGNLFNTPNERPYLKIVKTSPTRFDILGTYSHPENYNPGLFHCYYEGGSIRNSFGAEIGKFASPPSNIAATTQVFDGVQTGGNSWQSSFDRIGTKLFGVASVFQGGSGYYIRVGFDTAAPAPWAVDRICDAGAPLTTYGFAGACVDVGDPDRAFVSLNYSNLRYQLVEMERRGANDWRAVRLITDTPNSRNLRPRTIMTTRGKYLTWLDGEFIGNTDFRSSMRLLKL